MAVIFREDSVCFIEQFRCELVQSPPAEDAHTIDDGVYRKTNISFSVLHSHIDAEIGSGEIKNSRRVCIIDER